MKEKIKTIALIGAFALFLLLAWIKPNPSGEKGMESIKCRERAEQRAISQQEEYRASIESYETQFLRENIEEVETTMQQRYYPTAEEFGLMSRVVMSEAGGESFDCQLAVAETILNRMWAEEFPDTISEVIHQDNQYSTHWNGEPTDSVMEAVHTACEIQNYPGDMYYFRDDYYHKFGSPYIRIDDMYFSRK